MRGFHQAVAVAVEVEHPGAPQREAGGGIALRVQLDQLELIARQVGDERDEVVFCHGVMERDKKLVLHPLDGQLVVLVGVLGVGDILRGQGDAAAAHHGLPGGVEHVAADGADIEFGAQEIGGTVPVDDRLPLHQLQNRDAQRSGQGLQQGDIGQALGRLPFGDGLGADGKGSGQLRLCEVFCIPQLPDGAAGDIIVHGSVPSFSSAQAYQNKTLHATYAAWSVLT